MNSAVTVTSAVWDGPSPADVDTVNGPAGSPEMTYPPAAVPGDHAGGTAIVGQAERAATPIVVAPVTRRSSRPTTAAARAGTT